MPRPVGGLLAGRDHIDDNGLALVAFSIDQGNEIADVDLAGQITGYVFFAGGIPLAHERVLAVVLIVLASEIQRRADAIILALGHGKTDYLKLVHNIHLLAAYPAEVGQMA